MKLKVKVFPLVLRDTAESMRVVPFSGMTSTKKVVKGAWWMPWLMEATKDVISCDKPR